MNEIKVGDPILIVDGQYQGFTGTVAEIDDPWVSILFRDGRRLLCAASLVRPLEFHLEELGDK